MSKNGPTWIVLNRDVSDSVHVRGQRETTVSMVLDAATGLVASADVGASPPATLAKALKNALIRPSAPAVKAVPARIVCPPDLFEAVAAASAKLDKLADTALVEGVEMWDAEEVLDTFVGHMEGRAQPTDPATVDDWRALYAALQAYTTAEPWQRWCDCDYFPIRLELEGVVVERTGIVLGSAGLQCGFNATADPDALERAAASEGDPLRHLEGSLIVHLDSWRNTFGVNATKARRYGWGPDTSLVPTLMTVRDREPADLGREEARLLTLALTGLVQQDAKRLVAVGSSTATGEVEFEPGVVGHFEVERPTR
jgi:hypothetical protein